MKRGIRLDDNLNLSMTGTFFVSKAQEALSSSSPVIYDANLKKLDFAKLLRPLDSYFIIAGEGVLAKGSEEQLGCVVQGRSLVVFLDIYGLRVINVMKNTFHATLVDPPPTDCRARQCAQSIISG